MKTQQKLKKETPHMEIATQFTHISTSQKQNITPLWLLH